jgi:hypothetical protein
MKEKWGSRFRSENCRDAERKGEGPKPFIDFDVNGGCRALGLAEHSLEGWRQTSVGYAVRTMGMKRYAQRTQQRGEPKLGKGGITMNAGGGTPIEPLCGYGMQSESIPS